MSEWNVENVSSSAEVKVQDSALINVTSLGTDHNTAPYYCIHTYILHVHVYVCEDRHCVYIYMYIYNVHAHAHVHVHVYM